MLLDRFPYSHGAKESALIAASSGGHESLVKMLLDRFPYSHYGTKASASTAAPTGDHESVGEMLDKFYHGHYGPKESALIASSAGDHEPAIISSMATALRPSLGPGDISPRATRKTKAHVASACVNCKKKHLRCDDSRPCRSCVQSGKEASCVDVEHKKRGRLPMKPEENHPRTFEPAVNPLQGHRGAFNRPPAAHPSSYSGSQSTIRDLSLLRPLPSGSDPGHLAFPRPTAPYQAIYVQPTVSPSPATATGTISRPAAHSGLAGHSQAPTPYSMTQSSGMHALGPANFSPYAGSYSYMPSQPIAAPYRLFPRTPKIVGTERLCHEISYAKAIASAIFGAISGGGHEIIVRMLLSRIDSAVIDLPQILGIVDNEGRTVLHLAVLRGYRRIVQLLLESGADVGIADRRNITPLFAAAASGATPFVLNSGAKDSLADPPDDLSAFHLMKLQLGLYVLGHEDSGYQRPMDKIKFLENSKSLYEYTCHEIGVALVDSRPSPEEQMKDLGDSLTSLLRDWGECLTGAHLRISMGSGFSAILRLDKLIGCGSQALGSHYIQVTVNLERKVGRTSKLFRLWEFLRASPSKQEFQLQIQQKLAYNMVLLYWTCSHEMKRAMAVCNGIPSRPHGGNCWRDAFGDVLELRLNRLGAFRQEIMVANKQASHEGAPISDDQLNQIFSTCVLSTLEDLTVALGIHSRAVQGDMIFLQGRYGTCVLIGCINQYPIALWHVCSIEEASLIASNPQQFIRHVGGNLICENSQGGQGTYQGNYLSLESLKGTILVGALVEPAWCSSVDTTVLLQAQGNGVVSGRTEANQIRGLQFESLSGQAQFSFGTQGPQGTIAIGGGVSTPRISEHIIAENSFSNSVTTLERALRSWVLVYQTYNGQFVEQNLYCVVSCVLQTLPANRNIVSDFNKILTAREWDLSLATLCRVCAAVISDPTPAVVEERLGGLDLREFARSCVKYRVWEKPAIQPGWVQIFGSLPTLSVDYIGLRSGHVQRCALLITVAGLERRIGKTFPGSRMRHAFPIAIGDSP